VTEVIPFNNPPAAKRSEESNNVPASSTIVIELGDEGEFVAPAPKASSAPSTIISVKVC
jgi:hypothetical protein